MDVWLSVIGKGHNYNRSVKVTLPPSNWKFGNLDIVLSLSLSLSLVIEYFQMDNFTIIIKICPMHAFFTLAGKTSAILSF